jgi:hypothetical protein
MGSLTVVQVDLLMPGSDLALYLEIFACGAVQ